MAGVIKLDALVVRRVIVLARRVGRVAVKGRGQLATPSTIGAAIKPGVGPRLVTGVVHALGGAAWRSSVGRLGRGTRARRDTAEECVQEGLVDERVLGSGLCVDQVAKMLL